MPHPIGSPLEPAQMRVLRGVAHWRHRRSHIVHLTEGQGGCGAANPTVGVSHST